MEHECYVHAADDSPPLRFSPTDQDSPVRFRIDYGIESYLCIWQNSGLLTIVIGVDIEDCNGGSVESNDSDAFASLSQLGPLPAHPPTFNSGFPQQIDEESGISDAVPAADQPGSQIVPGEMRVAVRTQP